MRAWFSALLNGYLALTFALGGQRRLVRRVAALCLVFMGVHLAADKVDDLIYGLLDAVDLFADDAAAAFLAWLADAGGISPASANEASTAFAGAVDLQEKDRLALVLALLGELALDVLLLDLAWGKHTDELPRSMLDELKESAAQVLAALRPLDLERLGVMPTLLTYALGGAVLSALAVEQVARDLLQQAVPGFSFAVPLAAALGIGAACLLVWRFLPDLLHGALLRSRARHDHARDKILARLLKKHRFPRLAAAVLQLRLASRGTWLCLLALPLAIAGLASQDLWGLVARTELLP